MEQLLKSEHRKMFMWHSIFWIVLGCFVGWLATYFAGASAGGTAAELGMINSGDTAWMLASSALVMIMTPAVGFFYGGMVSSKNVVSVIKQSMVILALISVQWVLFGYSLAFGPDVHGIIGNLSEFGLRGVGYAPDPNYAPTIPALVYMIFQAMFAIVTPALIIGAFVERIKFKTLVVFTVLWATLVYDPVAHWVWSPNGWLHTLGALDFAGGTVVHMTAGFSALAAAMLVGKRLGSNGAPAANNIPFVILGAALLWFGWFGFNAGSALAAGTLAASAFVVTNTAAAAAALTWVALSWAEHRKPSAMAAAVGAVCGLVAITPASGFVGPIASIAIGILGGAVTYLAVYLRNRKMAHIDDTLDVWAGHGIGGLAGALLTGVFAEKAINAAGNNGFLFGNPHQLWVQFIAVAAVGAYSFVATWVILKVVSVFFPLRVAAHEEETGLDLAVHGEIGYRY